MSNAWAVDVQQQIVNCDLIAIGAQYHKVCYLILLILNWKQMLILK